MKINSNSDDKLLPLIFWTLATILATWSLSTKIFDPDLWWHLAAGREMVTHKTLLRTEMFSHTMGGTPWINFEWLSQILLYIVMKGFGVGGIYGAKILLALLVFFQLVYSIRLAGARGSFLYLLSTVGFIVMRPRLQEKPELATLLCLSLFVIFVLWLVKSRDPRRVWVPWILGSLMIFWVNAHAGFATGLALLAMFVVGARFSNEEKDVISLMDRSFVTCLAAMLINPHGPRVGEIFLDHLFQFGSGAGHIEEWISPSIRQVPIYWMVFIVTGGYLVWGLLKKNQRARFWLPAVILFLWSSAQFYRSTALLAFVALPFLADLFSPWKASRFLWAMGLASFAAVLGTLPLSPRRGLVHWNHFPVQACDFIRRTGLQGTLYNSYEFGGYIEWALGPTSKVFYDGRYLFYPLLEMQRSDKRFLERFNVDMAVVYPLTVQEVGLQPLFDRSQWALVFWDDAAFVYVKRNNKFSSIIVSREYKYLWPDNPEKMRQLLKSHRLSWIDVATELERHKAEIGFSVLEQQMETLHVE